MTVKPKISVIVPVYNAENYIRRCVDSILAQSVGDFELILVDDGSTDLSGSICDEIASCDERIKTIHTANNGVSVARNTGIKAATGEYLSFVDADDELPHDAFANFLEIEKLHPGIDLITGYFTRNGKTLGSERDSMPDFIENNDVISKFTIYQLIGFSAWGKLVRRDIVIDNDVLFVPGITRGEDPLWCTTLMVHLGSVAQCKKVVYIYNDDNGGSEMHKKDMTRSYCSTLKVVVEVAKILSEKTSQRKAQYALAMEFLAPGRFDQAIENSDVQAIKLAVKDTGSALKDLKHTAVLRYMLWRLSLPEKWRNSKLSKFLSAAIKRILLYV